MEFFYLGITQSGMQLQNCSYSPECGAVDKIELCNAGVCFLAFETS